jgi:hypothetical protein
LAAVAACAGPLEIHPPTPGLIADDPFLLWDGSFTLRIGGGYSDNPTYARANRERSPFESTEADLLIFRLPTDQNTFHLFFSGEDRRYTSAQTGRKDDLFATVAEFSHTSGDWVLKLSAQHLFFDQVYDLSDQSLGFGFARANGHDLVLTPAVRRTFAGRWWIEFQALAEREYLGFPLDSFRSAGPKLALGLTYSKDSSLEGSVGAQWRPYDNTPLLSSTGDVVPDSNETLLTSTISLRWKHRFGQPRDWTLTLQGALVRNEDNGAGWYNNDRATTGGSLAWARSRWLLRGSARAAWYSFPIQWSNGAGSPLRSRHDYTAGLRAERVLSAKLKVYVEAEAQRSFANTAFDSYHQNWVLFGLEREF